MVKRLQCFSILVSTCLKDVTRAVGCSFLLFQLLDLFGLASYCAVQCGNLSFVGATGYYRVLGFFQFKFQRQDPFGLISEGSGVML